MKYDQDELYLILDFLEEQVEILKITDPDFYGENSETFDGDLEMFEKTIAVIKTLIKE